MKLRVSLAAEKCEATARTAWTSSEPVEQGVYEWQEFERVNPETREIQKVGEPHFIRLPGCRPLAFVRLMARWIPEGKEFTA
jgi:hypothetical protein